MYVYYFVQVDRPYAVVEPRLHSYFSRFNAWADAAYREGEELRTTIGVGAGRSLVAKSVRLWVGEPIQSGQSTSIRMVWEAVGAPGLFPTLNASLDVSPIGSELTHLALQGNYDPPLGALGRALDRAVLHRLAESSVKGFLDRIAVALESSEEV